MHAVEVRLRVALLRLLLLWQLLVQAVLLMAATAAVLCRMQGSIVLGLWCLLLARLCKLRT
jgi:hypothetical protein